MKNPAALQAFGSHLRKLREERNLSQQELADLADIPKITIQRIENTKVRATLDTLINIAQALNISLPVMMNFDMPKDG